MGCIVSSASLKTGLVWPGGLSPLGRVVSSQAGSGTYVSFIGRDMEKRIEEGESYSYSEVEEAVLAGPNWASVRREIFKVNDRELALAIPENVLLVDNDSAFLHRGVAVQLRMGDEHSTRLQMHSKSAKGGNIGLAVARAVMTFLKQQPRSSVTEMECDFSRTKLAFQLNLPVAAFRLQDGACGSQAKKPIVKQVVVGIRLEARIDVSEARLRPSIWPVAEKVFVQCADQPMGNVQSLLGKSIDRVVSKLELSARELAHRAASWQTLFVKVENSPENEILVSDFDPMIMADTGVASSTSSVFARSYESCNFRKSGPRSVGDEGAASPLPVLLNSLPRGYIDSCSPPMKDHTSPGHNTISSFWKYGKFDPNGKSKQPLNNVREEAPQRELPALDDGQDLEACECGTHWWNTLAHKGCLFSWWHPTCPSRMPTEKSRSRPCG